MITNYTITLRAPEPEDVDSIYLWENSPEMPACTLAAAPVSRHAIAEFVSAPGDIYSTGQMRLVIALCDPQRTPIGMIDVADYDSRNRHGFVSIYIASRYRRRGYGLMALVLLEEYLRDVVGTHQLLALVAYDNEASRALFKAAQYNTCGSLRSYLRRGPHYSDALLFQKLFPAS